MAGPGQVLIDVAFANITFVETQVRAGPGRSEAELPMIPGNGVGGVVTSVGTEARPAGSGGGWSAALGGSGGYAERAVVAADISSRCRTVWTLDAAVALLADGRTAMSLVRAAGLRSGDRVLVEAAAGGVGTLLVQLARTAGAVVVAAAGGERKVALARDLGAEVGGRLSCAGLDGAGARGRRRGGRRVRRRRRHHRPVGVRTARHGRADGQLRARERCVGLRPRGARRRART